MTSPLSFLKRLWPWTPSRRSPTRRPMDFASPVVPPPETAAPEAEAVLADKTTIIGAPLTETHQVEPENVVEPQLERLEGKIADAVNDKEEEEEEEDDPGEEAFVEDTDQLGEAVSSARMAIERALPETLRLRRAESLAEAMIGEHRIYLSDPTGPGSLAEALNTLVQQGRVTAKFQDDGEVGAFILYRAGAREV